MKRAFFLINLGLAFCLFTASAAGVTITWASGVSGDWSNPANWNPNQVPGQDDTAVITTSGNYAVTVDSNINVSVLILGSSDSTTQSLVLNGPNQNLDIDQSATVNTHGVIKMSNGALNFFDFEGGGILNGTLTISGGTLSGVLTIASNGVANLINPGGATQPVELDSLTLTNYGTIIWSNTDLQSQGNVEIDNFNLLNIQSDNTFTGAPPTTLNNYGTIRKNIGTYAPPNYVTRFNTMTFNNSGTVDVEEGAIVFAGGSGGGLFNAATNAGIALGNFTLTGDTTFTGPGAVQGTFYGQNGIIHGSMPFDYGSFSGTLTVATDGVLNLVGIDGETTPIALNYLTLTNYGIIVWSNIDVQCESSEIYNYHWLNIQSDNTFTGDPSTTLNNYGTIRKNIGTYAPPNYVTRFNTLTFGNSGTVDVEEGAIVFAGGSGGGLFNAATNAGIALGNFTLTGDTTFTGPGAVQGTFYGQNGIIHGSMPFDYGSFSGTLTVATDGVLNLVGIDGETTPIALNYLSLTNYGTVVWSNIDLEGSSAQVYNYGLWEAQSDNTFAGGGNGVSMSTFNNHGTVRKDGGSGITTFDSETTFNNFGTVDVESFQINIDTGSGGGLFNTASNAIVWLGNPDGFTLSGDVTFTGPGLVGGNLNGFNTAGIIHGTLNFYYGSLGGFLTVASNAVANLMGLVGPTAPLYLNYVNLTNCGTVNWNNTELKGSSAQIYNYGLWNAQSDNTFAGGGNGVSMSAFNNYGTVRKTGGSSITTFDNETTFNNFGTVDVESFQINIDTGSGGGLFNTASNAIVWLGNPDGFTLSGDVTFTGPGLVGGNLNGFNTAGIIHGTLNFYYGSLGGFLTVASNAVANLMGLAGPTAPLYLNYVNLTNCGTVNWNNTDLEGTSAQIYNYGLWDAQSDNTFAGGGNGVSMSAFNNYGTVRKTGGNTITSFDNETTFNSSGTVDVETAEIAIGTGTSSGLFNTASNAVVSLGNPDGFTLSGDVTFTGPGLVGGNLNGFNTAGVIHGTLNFYSGSLGGFLTVASNAVANLMGLAGPTGPLYLNYVNLTNCGTVNWNNTDLEGTSAQIYNYGLWDAQSDNNFAGGGNGVSMSTFNNHGTVRKDGGSAITTFDSATTFNNIGKTDVQKGQVTMEGSCSLTNGTLNFGICGPGQFGTINFANNVQLAGRLSVNFRNHYTPVVSNSFSVVEFASETGTFTSLSLPALPSGLSWQNSYTSAAFTLSILAASPLHLSADMSAGGNGMSLSWNGLSGQTYQVQCTTNLWPPNWVNLGDPIAGTNGPISVLDSLTASPQKYYRIESQ